MALSLLPILVAVEDLFIRAPGHERQEETLIPGVQSLNVVVEGAYGYLNSGLVTLIVLPALAAILYFSGYRIAGPLVALFSLGLFLAKMFGSPA